MALTTGLISYYKMDEQSWNGSGGEVLDALGTNNGTGVGGIGAANPAGIINKCGSFDGATQYISIPDSPSLEITGDFTLSLWLNPNATQNPTTDLLRKELNNNNTGYGIERNGTDLNYTCFWKDGTQTQLFGTVNVLLVASVWNHMLWTKSGATLTGYLNAASQGSGTGSNATIGTDARPLELGKWTGQAGRYYTGLMDEVGIWSRALSGSEITQLYNNGSGRQYPFPLTSIKSQSFSHGWNYPI